MSEKCCNSENWVLVANNSVEIIKTIVSIISHQKVCKSTYSDAGGPANDAVKNPSINK